MQAGKFTLSRITFGENGRGFLLEDSSAGLAFSLSSKDLGDLGELIVKALIRGAMGTWT